MEPDTYPEPDPSTEPEDPTTGPDDRMHSPEELLTVIKRQHEIIEMYKRQLAEVLHANFEQNAAEIVRRQESQG